MEVQDELQLDQDNYMMGCASIDRLAEALGMTEPRFQFVIPFIFIFYIVIEYLLLNVITMYEYADVLSGGKVFLPLAQTLLEQNLVHPCVCFCGCCCCLHFIRHVWETDTCTCERPELTFVSVCLLI
jgi:hypothetical protein